VLIFDAGKLAGVEAGQLVDLVKGAGTFDQYSTYTFQDGSTITARMKSTIEATPAGVASLTKWAGEIINGTSRSQGIKGTVTSATKFLPPKAPIIGTNHRQQSSGSGLNIQQALLLYPIKNSP